MRYLAAGKLIVSISFLVLRDLLLECDQLGIAKRFLGWFLVEHLFEEYDVNSGKFFLINLDFRMLIKNLAVIIRNFIFLAQSFTPIEFLIVNFLLVIVSLGLVNFNSLNVTARGSVVAIYMIFVLRSFLVVDSFLMFDLIESFLFITLSTVIACIYVYILIAIVKFSKRSQVFILLKSLFWCIMFSFIISVFLNIGPGFWEYSENFLHEFFVNALILYSYFYY